MKWQYGSLSPQSARLTMLEPPQEEEEEDIETQLARELEGESQGETYKGSA